MFAHIRFILIEGYHKLDMIRSIIEGRAAR